MKKLFTIILLAILCANAMAYDFSAVCSTEQTLYYTITSDVEPYTVEVTSENATSPYYTTYPTGDLEIPETVEYNSKTYSVTSIGENAFYNCSGLTSVTIGNSVTSIGSLAFDGCTGLTAVYYTGTIEQWCGITFEGLNPLSHAHNLYIDNAIVTDLVIPETITEIKNYAFAGASFTSVTIPASVTSIGTQAFYYCNNLSTVNFNAENCTTMGGINSAFYDNTSITTLNIGERVKVIPDYAFYNCSGLTEITIPDSILSIGDQAFSACSYLTTVNFNAENCTTMGSSDGPVFYSCTSFETLNIGENVKNIPDYAFKDCSGLVSVTIPDSVTSIGNNAFTGCTGLTTVNFNAKNCTYMGNSNTSGRVFSECTSLTTLNIGENVESIPNYAFYSCKSLASLTIPESVTAIGNGAFSYCEGLTGELVIPNSVITIGSENDTFGAFWHCNNITSVTIGNSVETIGKCAFQDCSSLTSITIPESVTSIYDKSFESCTSLTTVNFNAENCTTMGSSSNPAFADCSLFSILNIGERVKNIPSYAFYNCSGLTDTLTIPDSVTNIGERAFYGCSGLSAVNFNATNCTTMGDVYPVFINCTNLTTLNIGENVKNIPNGAFYNCSTLTGTLTIPISVTSIDENAFYGCRGLEIITIGDSVTSIGGRAFYGCTGLTTVNFNAQNCTTAGTTNYSAFSNGTFTTLNIGNNVKNIPDYAFYGCTGLSEITIPDSVTNIGNNAFSGCTGLTAINFNAENCTTMGSLSSPVFEDCTNVTIVNISENVRNIPSFAFSGCSGLTSVYYAGDVAGWCGITFNSGANPLQYAHNLYIDNELVTDLVIPETVTELKAGAFNGASCITSVTIPNSVATIGNYAFQTCSGLTEVTIPNSVTTIGNCCFNYCSQLTTVNFNATNCTEMGAYNYPVFNNCTSLLSLNIGEDVINIPDNAFRACSELTTVNFNANNCTNIGDDVWYQCASLTTLYFGERVKNIPERAFENCTGLTEITIPDSVTNIGTYAFYRCSSLDTVTIGKGVESIGERAFSECSGLTTLNFNAENCTTMGGTNPVFEDCTNLATLNIGESVKSIPDYAFSDCTGLTEITIPDSVTNIGSYAFRGCSGLTEITIPDLVVNIGSQAFNRCSSLSVVNFNAENCTTMGTLSSPVFFNNTSITTLNIGERVKSIPDYAFSDCSALTEITIPDSVTSIGQKAFYACSGLTTLNFNAKNCTVMGSSNSHVFDNCTSLSTLNIGENVKILPDCAFYNCSALTDVTIPDSVVSIGERAFYGCSTLTTVNFNAENCTTMGSSSYKVFENGSMLTTLNIGEKVKNIPDYAFNGCSNMTGTLVIPDSVINIGTYAFGSCSSLDTLTIGKGVESIGERAFSDCSELTVINFNAENCTTMGSQSMRTFEGCTSFSTLNIGDNVVGVPENAFYNCSNLTSATIGDSVTNIGSYAFSGCSGLTRLIVPDMVTNIGSRAFYNCSGLDSITIGSSVENIGDYAFHYADNITEINALATTPPVLGTQVFTSTTAKLEVPCSSSAAYGSASGWSDFDNLQERFGYTLSVSTENEQQGTASITQQPSCSDNSAVITATPATGYRFLQWSDGNTDNPRTVVVTSDITYTAGFKAAYIITATAGEGGTITPSGEVSVDDGESQTFTIEAEECYSLASVLVDDVDVTDAVVAADGVYTFENVTTGHTISASFEQITYTITVTAGNGGMITPTGNVDVACGENIDFTITPNDGYRISSVLVDGIDAINDVVDGVYTFENVTANHTIYATFEAILPVADFTTNPETTGDTLSIMLEQMVEYTNTSLNAHHIHWYFEGADTVESTQNYVPAVGYREEGTFLTTLVAYNEDETLTDTATLTVVVRDTSYYTITAVSANEEYGTVTGGGTYDEGTQVLITATPYEGYRFVSWDDENTENPRTITVTSDSTFVANFEQILESYTITVMANDDAYGTVTGGGTYDEGTQALITATPYEGYQFVSWNDSITDNPRTITITSDSTFVAIFEAEQLQQYTLTVLSNNDTYGSVSGSGTYYDGDTVVILAMPNSGYNFVSWDDGYEFNPRAVVVTSDSTFIADFAKCEITYAIDTVVNNFVTVGDHTFYSTGNYTFAVSHETACDTIYDIRLRVLAEPVYDIGPNPTKSLLNINSDGFISAVEFYSVTGQLVMRKEVNGYEAEFDVEGLMDGVYILRIYGEESSLPSVTKIIKE